MNRKLKYLPPQVLAAPYRHIFDHRRHAVEQPLKLAQVYMWIPKKLIQAYKVLQCSIKYNPDHLIALSLETFAVS